jgi:hypothetical protein
MGGSGMPEGGPEGALHAALAAFIYITRQEMVSGMIMYLLTLSLHISVICECMQSLKVSCLAVLGGHIKAFISLVEEGSDL